MLNDQLFFLLTPINVAAHLNNFDQTKIKKKNDIRLLVTDTKVDYEKICHFLNTSMISGGGEG